MSKIIVLQMSKIHSMNNVHEDESNAVQYPQLCVEGSASSLN